MTHLALATERSRAAPSVFAGKFRYSTTPKAESGGHARAMPRRCATAQWILDNDGIINKRLTVDEMRIAHV